MSARATASRVLTVSTLSFAACFAVWMMNGVLVTWLVDRGVMDFDKVQIGWLLGAPVLSGAILRLPVNILSDRLGGRVVFATVMLLTGVACVLFSFAGGFTSMLLGSLCFGVVGASFAAGVGYCSDWYPSERQGQMLGVFGAGSVGGAITALAGPWLLVLFTNDGARVEGWRELPRSAALMMLIVTVLFLLSTPSKQQSRPVLRTLAERLEPLRRVRVWRFGLYYFLLFGGFTALAQWLMPYYMSVYSLGLAEVGVLVACFILPAGVLRAVGPALSRRFGARSLMYWVLAGCAVASAMLMVPRMQIESQGEAVLARRGGVVSSVSPTAVEVGGITYPLEAKPDARTALEGTLIWPALSGGHEVLVSAGEAVPKRAVLARRATQIYFQANLWVFAGLVSLLGALMGLGQAAVYAHIPEYYPRNVSTVGGHIGVIGGLGGFVCPVAFGYLVEHTGLWTTAWSVLLLVSMVCLAWMHWTIRALTLRRAPEIANVIEDLQLDIAVPLVVTCPIHGLSANVRVIAHIGDSPVAYPARCSLLGSIRGAPSCGGQCVTRSAELKTHQ